MLRIRIRIPDEHLGHISESLETICWVKILKFFDADPGWKKFGSEINIPDPQNRKNLKYSQRQKRLRERDELPGISAFRLWRALTTSIRFLCMVWPHRSIYSSGRGGRDVFLARSDHSDINFSVVIYHYLFCELSSKCNTDTAPISSFSSNGFGYALLMRIQIQPFF